MLTRFLRRRHGLRCALRRLSTQNIHETVPAAVGSTNSDNSNKSSNGTRLTPIIHLTPQESNLFDFLVYIQHLYAPKTQLRVAGGWVRDKLRGAESDDIDIVLDNMYGKKFAGYITKFQKQRKLPPSSVGVVKANSEKSKHLEVATVSIEGHMVDLVHLRGEEYTVDSRIPVATFAEPAEDAFRRDITINALFYNLHTHEVEDFTGKGLEDLANGMIRTPLEPGQTFLDDPLRVLRAIRFACEFGFTLDPKLAKAVCDEQKIKDAMIRKVSRERIGIEVRKMLSGKDPARAFGLLADFGLLDIVFNNPATENTVSVQPEDNISRRWTKQFADEALHYLQFLQQSRLALASHQISFVEASGAILTALFITPSVPVLTDLPSLEPLSSTNTGSGGIDEDTVLTCALDYVNTREAIARGLPMDEMIDTLKVNVKWPKPAAKRAALIVEAVAAFPVSSSDPLAESEAFSARLKLYMWMVRYNTVISPALSILVAKYPVPEERDEKLKALLELAATYTKQRDDDAQQKKRRRMDGNAIKAHLGVDAGPKIAKALQVLQVWEMVAQDASADQEMAFFHRLAPVL